MIAEGSDDTTLYVVESGELEVIHRGVRLGRIPTGEGFGEIAFIEGTDRPRVASVRTVVPTKVIAFSAEALKQASGALQAAFGRAIVQPARAAPHLLERSLRDGHPHEGHEGIVGAILNLHCELG